jgi:hypothetical protein
VEVVQVKPGLAIGLAGGLALLAGCPSTQYLQGSLGQLMDLSYDEVRVLLAPDDFSLQFVRIHQLTSYGDAGTVSVGTSEDYPFEVDVYRWGRPIAVGSEMDLAEFNDAGVQRAVFTRNVLNDPRKTFPPCVRGGLKFDSLPADGKTVSGEFHVTFEDGVETASGRAVFGSFTAKTKVTQ